MTRQRKSVMHSRDFVQESNTLFCSFPIVCNNSLGMENKGIADGKLSSSSSRDSYPATKGRLNGRKAWIPSSSDSSPWIQVNLGQLTHVAGVKTQGKADDNQDQWVTKYNVLGSSGYYWHWIRNSDYAYVSMQTTYIRISCNFMNAIVRVNWAHHRKSKTFY